MNDKSTADKNTAASSPSGKRAGRRWIALLLGVVVVTAGVTFGVTALLVSIFEHRQEARTPYVRLVDVNEVTTDPVPWGTNWPFQYDGYRRTVDVTETEHGGSEAMPASKLEKDPWLRRLYAGYAFSIDYRKARGHAFMLFDQEVTERVTKRKQSGACLHCHASIIPTYRRLGMEAAGEKPDTKTLAADFNWPAVMKGFELASAMDYSSAHDELLKTPDGTPETTDTLFPGGKTPGGKAQGNAHPVSCIDCHDPKTMQVRVTRPGFVRGIAALAESDDPVPHLPSIERWRQGDRKKKYDPNVDASRQEMRSFVCAQCHVEYYCAAKETLFFPWQKGLKAEQIEETYDKHTFPDGTPFFDYKHAETGALAYKAQHPEFELWSQGVHARSGVSCADCHMPYERQGAAKVSSHLVRSPLLNINHACQTCHHVSEEELRDKVKTIQGRTKALLQRAAKAMTDMLDAIEQAQAVGATPEELAPILELQKKAMWRLDFISSENSIGFHAGQEAARILGESIDYSRQAEAMALRLRLSKATPAAPPANPTEPGQQ
ncbi:MAG: ammonia-forming cytochrome c nitrite reductase subunit c552 [Pirellulales bacterium]|nr:ammonia-forming cytochrome c nitrite reductase subunit c552 [Pirellulales bacterium]